MTSSLLALALLVPALLVLAPPAAAATTRTLTISSASADPAVDFKAFDGSPVKAFDFDGDGDLELIAHNDNRYLYVFDSRTGALLAEITTRYPAFWGARPLNGPEAAVMVRDGATHLIVYNSAAYLTDFRFEGVEGGKFKFAKVWERRLTDCYGNPGADSRPHLADVDKDGDLEILLQVEETGVYAVRHDGSLLWKRCIGGGNADASTGDTNGDGFPEAVFVSDGGVVSVFDGRTGAYRWTHWTGGAMPVGATVAQLDGTGGADVIVGVRDKHDCEDFENNHAWLFAIKHDGRLLWKKQDPNGNPLTYTHPIVFDVDNDGQKDVLWGDWNTQGHKCGNWEQTGPANYYRYDAAGNLRWKTSLNTFWSNKDLALADVDGDGVQEILANGPNGGQDGLWYLNSITGAKETFVSTYPWKVTRGPVVEDLWNTNTMQWVVPVYAYGSGSSGGALLVYDTGQPWSAGWPHLPYASFQAGSFGDPDPEPEPDPDPDPVGPFAATFAVPSSVNTWWVEAKVNANEAVGAVEAQVNGGSWVALAKQSWGAWAKSFHVPTGSQVLFRATSGDGDRLVSGTYTWPTGGTTTGTPPTTLPPPPPTTFDASFSVPSSVNNWWVEVKATGNEAVTAVEAQVNGGSWQALGKQSWGNWAKSFFVPTGASVVFRATGASGGTDTSAPVSWLGGSGGDPGDPGTFSATLTPVSVTKNWWIEAKVSGATQTVASVAAQVNGGTWTDLPKTDWGTWAKSFFVADGAQVKFRATSTGGAEAFSGTHTWG